MPEEINVNKSLIKKVVTFLNEYIDNPYIVCGYTKFANHINVNIQIWTLNGFNLCKNIVCFLEDIDSTTDLDSLKLKIKEKINKALEQLKEN